MNKRSFLLQLQFPGLVFWAFRCGTSITLKKELFYFWILGPVPRDPFFQGTRFLQLNGSKQKVRFGLVNASNSTTEGNTHYGNTAKKEGIQAPSQ